MWDKVFNLFKNKIVCSFLSGQIKVSPIEGMLRCSWIKLFSPTDWKLPIPPTLIPTFWTTESSLISTISYSLLQPNTTQSHHQYPQGIPPRLVKKVLSLEYIDMAELLLENYDYADEAECSHSARSARRSPVANIIVWLDCYASLMSVLCSAYPEKFGQFILYQKTIFLAHCRFAGEGWVIYDGSYHRQASNARSLDWGQIDGHLRNEIFTGKAKAIACRRICLSEMHSHVDCPQVHAGSSSVANPISQQKWPAGRQAVPQ